MSGISQMLLLGREEKNLMSAITDAGLTTNLKLCLDAGVAASYDPGVQTDKWLDLAGAGYDFYRGSGTGSDANDPTFTGSAGALSSYWLFNSDYFSYDKTNEAWMETIHKNNAIFTIIAFTYPTSGGHNIVGDSGALTGFVFSANSTLVIGVENAGAAVLSKTGDTSIASNTWNMTGVSINEATGAGGGFLYTNGAYNQVAGSNTFDSTYTSPSASSASFAMQIASNNGGLMNNNARVSCLAIWQGTALTKANMDTIWAAMRGRFGI